MAKVEGYQLEMFPDRHLPNIEEVKNTCIYIATNYHHPENIVDFNVPSKFRIVDPRVVIIEIN